MLESEVFYIYPVDIYEDKIEPLCYTICAGGLAEAVGEAIKLMEPSDDMTFFIPGYGFVESSRGENGLIVWDEGLWDKDLHPLVYKFVKDMERKINHVQVCNDILQDLIVQLHAEIVEKTGEDTKPWLKDFLEATGRKD